MKIPSRKRLRRLRRLKDSEPSVISQLGSDERPIYQCRNKDEIPKRVEEMKKKVLRKLKRKHKPIDVVGVDLTKAELDQEQKQCT